MNNRNAINDINTNVEMNDENAFDCLSEYSQRFDHIFKDYTEQENNENSVMNNVKKTGENGIVKNDTNIDANISSKSGHQDSKDIKKYESEKSQNKKNTSNYLINRNINTIIDSDAFKNELKIQLQNEKNNFNNSINTNYNNYNTMLNSNINSNNIDNSKKRDNNNTNISTINPEEYTLNAYNKAFYKKNVFHSFYNIFYPPSEILLQKLKEEKEAENAWYSNENKENNKYDNKDFKVMNKENNINKIDKDVNENSKKEEKTKNRRETKNETVNKNGEDKNDSKGFYVNKGDDDKSNSSNDNLKNEILKKKVKKTKK